MKSRYSKYCLAIFAASLLLMQSLAVWHDAEHVFHDHVALCDQLNVISQTQTIDNPHSLSLNSWSQFFKISGLFSELGLFQQSFLSFSIRAPPTS